MKKECPSCAMEIDDGAATCPVCGYEFPGKRRGAASWIAILLLIMGLLSILFGWFLF